MTATPRHVLPSRRPTITHTIVVCTERFHVSLGYHPFSFELREIFISGAKVGSDMDSLLDDVSIVLTLALQYNISLKQLMHSLYKGRSEGAKSLIGRIIKLIELEQKKLRNIALLEEAKNFNEFEEYSED